MDEIIIDNMRINMKDSYSSRTRINLINIMLIIYCFSIIVFDEGSNILKLIKVIFISISFLLILKRGKLYINLYIWWMILFTLFCFLSSIWSLSSYHAIYNSKSVLLNNICLIVIINLILLDEDKIITVLKTIFFSSLILGLRVALKYGIFVFASGLRGGMDGVVSANTLGLTSAVAIVFGYYLIQEKKYEYIMPYILGMVINVIILILSASRKAIIFVIMPMAIYYVVKEKNLLKKMNKVIFVLLGIFILFLFIMNNEYLYSIIGIRIETMMNGILGIGKTDGSTSLRLKMIDWGVEWFKEKPYLGYGINNYRYLLGTTKETSFGIEGAYAHNNYIELLVDVGIIGLFLYYYVYIKMIKKYLRKKNELNLLQICMLGVLISLLIIEYGIVSYYDKFLQLLLVLIWTSLNIKNRNIYVNKY